MKKLRNLFIVLMFILSICILLTACDSKDSIKLDAPDTFSVEESVVSWNVVENADKYIIRINGIDYETLNNEFNIQGATSAGINKIQIRAKGYETKNTIYQNSDFGEVLYIKKLESPTGIFFGNNQLSWGKVNNAKSYVLTLYDNKDNVIYSNTTTQRFVNFLDFSERIINLEYCIVGVSAVGDNQQNATTDDNIIFATIPSSVNLDYRLKVSKNMKNVDYFNLNIKEQKFNWENIAYSAGYKVEIKSSLGKVIFSKIVKDNYLSLNEGIPADVFGSSGKYIVSIQTLAPDSPIWITDSYSAIYAENNSKISEFEIIVDLNAQLPKVQNFNFYGETHLYYTHIRWDKLIGTSSYLLELRNENNNILYSTKTTYDKEYIAGTFNEITRRINYSGKYEFLVKALPDSDNLYIYDGKIVKFTSASELSEFEFDVNITNPLDSPTNITLGGSYVGSQFNWNKVDNAVGYLITIEDSNGNIVYERSEEKIFNDNKYFLIDSNLKSYLSQSGIYTLKIQSVGLVQINYSSILKRQDSNAATLQFYFDKESDKISNAD